MEVENWGSKSFQKKARERGKLFENVNRRRGITHNPVDLGPLLTEISPIQEAAPQDHPQQEMLHSTLETDLPSSEV